MDPAEKERRREAARAALELEDDALLRDCEVTTFVGG